MAILNNKPTKQPSIQPTNEHNTCHHQQQHQQQTSIINQKTGALKKKLVYASRCIQQDFVTISIKNSKYLSNQIEYIDEIVV